MFFVIALVAFLASLLTLFSGFGLGTLLTPVFGLFFPIHVAVALTGIVHLFNNLFKVNLLGKEASREMVFRFGIPSVLGGLVGALLLSFISEMPPMGTWALGKNTYPIHALKLVVAVLMIFFALMELLPALKKWNVPARYLSLGGLTSGFFGGLSGHQGALRSAFLVNAGLGKEQFVATGVVIACLVDLTRLPVYFVRFEAAQLYGQWPLLLCATLSAFSGAWIGFRFLKKTTLKTVQRFTALFIIVVAILLALGIL
jgi:uncharacterized protein